MLQDEMIARVEISNLMSTYNTAGDSGRREDFSTVFARDAVLEAPGIHFTGLDAIVSGLFSSEVKVRFVRHHLTTSKLTFLANDTVRGRTYFQVISDNGLDHCGVYSDSFKREDGAWKIAHRKVLIDFVSEDSCFFPEGLPERGKP
jgi:hypothetical protein